MRTQRWPVWSSVAPASAARASSASEIVSSPTTSFQSTSASFPNCFLRSSAGAGVASPATLDPGLHEALGPDEVDAEALELGGGDVDEVLGDVEFQVDRGGFVFERQIGQAGDERRSG